MEDCYKIRFKRHEAAEGATEPTPASSDILFSYFGIFDGHGGKEAAQFAKENLYWKIIESDEFWCDDENKVLKAIHDGFVKCHIDMWKELPNWPKTASGLPSTSGCTATVLFIRKSKAYVGHCGDSGLMIGCGESLSAPWTGKKLTRDHKPEDPKELKRIEKSGGQVVNKGGVNRVVWNRPVDPDEGDRRPSRTEKVPFLAVARSLGDLWSYNYDFDEFVVSPIPDVFAFEIDPSVHRCIVLATDGLWNVMRPNDIVDVIRQTDKETEELILKARRAGKAGEAQPFINPSQRLVSMAVQRCAERMVRADNTTCITIMLDLPGLSFSDRVIRGSNETMSDSQLLDEVDDSIGEAERDGEASPEYTRSKSLISLRRRRWSATSTRSTATTKSHANCDSKRDGASRRLFNRSYACGENFATAPIDRWDEGEDVDGEVGVGEQKKDDLGQKSVKKGKIWSYRARLKVLKSRLIKTKNSILNRKKRLGLFGSKKPEKDLSVTAGSAKKRKSMNRSYSAADHSILGNFRSRLSSLKRRSTYRIDQVAQENKKFKYA